MGRKIGKKRSQYLRIRTGEINGMISYTGFVGRIKFREFTLTPQQKKLLKRQWAHERAKT